ncbi:helix-turn-helix domain-containing protein [Bradyrhizobium sp. LHD-71]|uniref:helix-turn-helix domain-containing protein n=1 Tax=Bradyrhizobium sp. LHD-71 TaxID=3072141 RepID=UPI00280F809F|nr:helix-turn-helix domain-containing protein [Bradyrhizobium sp. LHD-71]MDQ8730888.1 helix-turn-helix domain-containing protein [Bradyrhizobium sp. LHD-71]
MSDHLLTVEQAAEQLNLHPKTVLRYIHDGRLPATRVGKSYRIPRARLDAFAGIAGGRSETVAGVRTTCIVDVPDISVDRAQRMATFLHSAALAGNAETPPLHLETAFDPLAKSMKVVAIGSPSDVSKLLEMLQLQLRQRS